MMTGGSFGRRAVTDADMIVEAVAIAKAIGWKAPVKVQWTREDDMTGGRYRPVYFHAIKAASTPTASSSPGGTASSASRSWPARRSRRHGRQGRRPDLGRGRDQPALCHPEPRGRPGHDRGRRAGAVVALGGLDPHRLRDRGDHRRAGAAAGKDPVEFRLAPCSRTIRAIAGVLQAGAPRRPAGARRCPRAVSRRRGARDLQHLRGPGGRGQLDAQGGRQGRAGGLRGRLRHRGQPRRHPGADGGRHRLRPGRHPARRDHARRAARSCRPTSTATRCCGSTRCRRSRCTSCPRPSGRPASASPACRRSARRSPTPIARPPASGSACCRSPRASLSAKRLEPGPGARAPAQLPGRRASHRHQVSTPEHACAHCRRHDVGGDQQRDRIGRLHRTVSQLIRRSSRSAARNAAEVATVPNYVHWGALFDDGGDRPHFSFNRSSQLSSPPARHATSQLRTNRTRIVASIGSAVPS